MNAKELRVTIAAHVPVNGGGSLLLVKPFEGTHLPGIGIGLVRSNVQLQVRGCGT